MAAIVAFVYIISTLLYLAIGDNSRLWGGLNHINLLVMISAMIYFPKPTSALQKDMLSFALGITIVRCLYTVICMFAERAWIYEVTDYFTITCIISFIAFIIYSAVAHRKF